MAYILFEFNMFNSISKNHKEEADSPIIKKVNLFKKNKLAVVACACASVSEYITTSRSAIAYVFVYCKNICQHSSVNYKINSYSVKAFRIPPISIILFIKRRLSLKLSSNANPLL